MSSWHELVSFYLHNSIISNSTGYNNFRFGPPGINRSKIICVCAGFGANNNDQRNTDND